MAPASAMAPTPAPEFQPQTVAPGITQGVPVPEE
jgi:hypothetical protein